MQGNRRAQTCSELDFELCLRKITRKSDHNCLKNSYLKQCIWKKLKCTPTGRGEKKVSVSLFIPSKLTLWVWYIQLMTWLFFKHSILNLALSVFFFLKEEPFHFSCTIHVIISRLSEHFAMIFSTESLGEWLISIVIYHWHQSKTRSDSKEVVLQATLLYKLAGFRKGFISLFISRW